MAGCRVGVMLSGLALLTVAVTAQSPAEDILGLRNRWYTTGGSASRSGSVLTEALEERPEPKWQHDAGGELVGEPLVWDDVVVIEVQLPKNVRRLVVLGLDDGVQLATRDFRGKTAARTLLPTLWGNEVVIRAGELLKRLRFSAAGFAEQRSVKFGDLGAPLRLAGDVYVLVGGAIECLDAHLLKRQWRSAETGYVGRLTVVGADLYALRHRDKGAELVCLDRGTGRQRSTAAFPLPLGQSEPRLLAGGRRLFVRDLPPIPILGGGSADTLAFDLPLPAAGAEPTLMSMVRAPVVGAETWLGRCGNARQPMLGLGRAGSSRVTVLATDKAHSYLLEAPITVAGPTAYLGGTAVDLETLEVRWRIDAPAGARPIPARDTLLYPTKSGVAAFGRTGDDLGRASRQRAAGWQEALAQHSEVALRKLVEDAMAVYEWALVDELLERCRAVGVDEKWVAGKAKKRLAQRRKKAKDDGAHRDALLQRAAEVDGAALAQLWQQLAVDDKPDRAAKLHALRFVLERASAHAGATAAVRELVPDELRGGDGTEFAALEWLQFLDSIRTIPIDFLPVVAESEIGSATADQLKLLEFRARWRKDLIAVTSPRLCVYTPVEAHGSLSRCLTLGELVCDTLESMFAEFPVRRQDSRRMRIQLFPTEAEYKHNSPGGGHLAWTAGHYSASEELSRMFLPAERQAFRRVMPVFVHELTHQWLQDRCPALATHEMPQRREAQPAYWIVEGFASFVEEFAFDVELGTHRTDSQRDENLDILGHASERLLLPWSAVLRATAMDFQKISPVPRHKVMLGYRLGVHRQLSPRNLFYAQAAALCHWMWHAEDGRRRQALLEFVLAYYQGQVDKLDLTATLGMSAQDIGDAVRAYAVARKPAH